MDIDHLLREMNALVIPDILYQKIADENSIKKMIQHLIENDALPSIKRESKNEETAKKKLEEGNKMISSAPLDKLIEIYNEVIAYALPSSELLARGFANRSAALTNGGMYEDSSKDIERALEIGYPDNLKAKLYARKAKNLLALNSMMSSEVDDAITQANIWVEKMDDNNRKRVKSSLDQLKIKKSSKKPFKFWEINVFLPKIPDDNPKILRASGAIGIKNSETFGRHLVATKDIKAGETLWVHRSYAFTLMSEYRYRHCWNCSRYTWSSIPCNQCSNVIYCNEECRDTAWQNHHDVECPAITAILAQFGSSVEKCLLWVRLLVRALKEFEIIEALYDKVNEIESTRDPILKLFTGNVYDDTKYASVYSLFRSKSYPMSIMGIERLIVEILFLLSGTTEILFGKKIDDPTELMNNKWTTFIGNLICRHIEIVLTNSLKITSNDCQGNYVACGSYLAPLLDLCSHSCDYNIDSIRSRDIVAPIAVQPIKKGQQICITYGPNYWQSPAAERRQSIQKSFKFLCQCTACVNGWGPDYQPLPCVEQLPDKITHELIIISLKCATYIPMINLLAKRFSKDITPSKIIEMMSDLSSMLNLLGGDRYPCKEMIKAKKALARLIICIRRYT
ncbi:SET and MYND domain-containing protein 4-like [Microplitis mediator]|uniref:SET and MYND domain-containing protein 4-like n=1 Tax=Microplitis mediator TaxID=375433 RepID=UPI0025523024|nr:SET and MYND domain-containing protein 4-like [Microplitis mediator]XP_057331020.1 SET and MYND domain-containing protein 4-like [Microplitis mediator]